MSVLTLMLAYLMPFGGYDLDANEMAEQIKEWAQKAGFLNIVGGCCGTTPAHIFRLLLKRLMA